MDWIKRNLYFLIGGAVALALMGLAGWFLYSNWQLNNAEMEKLNQDYAELQRLNAADPHPGAGKVDNIKVAQAQETEVRNLIKQARTKFQPISRIPDVPQVTEMDFSSALSRTIDQLQKSATNSGIILPPNYLFSFAAQSRRVSFATNSLDRLAQQLGEVKAICDILYGAGINSLDGIRRERVSADDQSGPLTDYFSQTSVTNELAVLSPYEVSFRTFSAELAAVLEGFANSPNGIVVKAINVDTAPAPVVSEEMVPAPMAPIYQTIQPTAESRSASDAAAAARFAQRYGMGGRGGRYGPSSAPTPVQPTIVYAQPGAAATPKGPQAVINERQLKVTLMLNVVKLVSDKPQETEPQTAVVQ